MRAGSLQEGDRVAFARAFLRSTGQFTGPEAPTSYGPFARGEVERVHRGWRGPFDPDSRVSPWVDVRWDDGRRGTVHVGNLVRVDRLHLTEPE